MHDLIERQAAIDALERKKDKNANGDIGRFYNKIIQNDIDAIMQLPSAQPEGVDLFQDVSEDYKRGYRDGLRDKKERLEPFDDTICRQEAICRQAAVDAFVKYVADGYAESPNDFEGYMEIVKKLPSAQPEIIRCRDCKHWDKTWTNNWSPDYHYCPKIDEVRKGDFYCRYAERRTDDLG